MKCLNLLSGSLHVATGGRDALLRIWRIYGANNDVSAFELVQELNGHQNYITAIAGTNSVDKLYSADYGGVIIEWSKSKTDRVYYELARFELDIFLLISLFGQIPFYCISELLIQCHMAFVTW